MSNNQGNNTQELIAAVREAAEGSPYVVTDKPYGFDLTIDIVDAQWWTLLRKSGVKRVFTYEVRTKDSAKKMSITDVSNTVRWSGGGGVSSVPSLHAEKSFQRGRVYQYSAQKEVGVDARTGQFGTPVSYSFRSGEGRDLIRAAAERHGWKESLPAEAKGAVIFAGAIVAVGAIVGLVFAAMALFG
jgi:hypothetical protein